MADKPWIKSALGLALALWGLQVLWLAWFYWPDVQEMARMAWRGQAGPALRQEDAIYRWSQELAAVIPPMATYVMLERYEPGKELEVRYHLAPRRHVLLLPQTPASFLFYALHQDKAGYLVVREPQTPAGLGVQAAQHSPACRSLIQPQLGLIFQVQSQQLHWGFYD